jgi:N-acetyltransferase
MNFDTTKSYYLENERALLRPLLESDIDYLQTFSINEPELWKYSLVQAIGVDGLKKYIQLALEAKAKGTEYPFIVFDKKENAYAGSTRFYDIQCSQKTLQLGYTWYGKQFQGTGLNKHCKYLLLEFAFEKLRMERVEFRADNTNARSIAAMKSIGCQVEGILRSNGYNPEGNRRDSIVLSILRQEWFDSVRTKLRGHCL